MKKILDFRINILVAIVCGIFLIFAVRLAQFQVIGSEEYYEQSNGSMRINQNLTAARGDIVDAYGVPLAGGEVVFDVTLNKAFMPEDLLNQRILRTLEIIWANSDTVNDILPITSAAPYSLMDDKETELSRLRDLIKVAIYAQAEDIMAKLVERYDLQEYTPRQQRALAGVRYTMEREGYSSSYPFPIAKDVSVETATQIKELSRSLTGVEITESSKRYYRDGGILPHILGTVGAIYAEEYRQLKEQGYGLNDMVGKSGLEKAYESYLRGTDGVVQIEKNVAGEITDMDVVTAPKPGNNLKLTIDAHLQQRANAIVENFVQVLDTKEPGWGRECEAVSMVVLDIHTGAVLAICNYPGYDLNNYSTNYSQYAANEYKPLFNRALQGVYRPGSTFKVNVAVAALSTGLIDENFTYTCHGVYDYYSASQWGGEALPGCANRTAHGTINVKEALRVSCNCFFYDLGRRLGIDTINQYAQSMGLGVYTGLEIGEREGVLSSPEYTELLGGIWQAGNIIQASIGQLDTMVTTVQLATYAATVANDGTRYATHIVDSIETYDGSKVIYETPVTVLSKLSNENNAFGIVKEGMIKVSAESYASQYLKELPFTVASKTGTAQVPGGFYNATMIAYGPVENPEIAVAVVAERGGNGYNIAMAVRDIFMAYYEVKQARADGTLPDIGYVASGETEENGTEGRLSTEETAPNGSAANSGAADGSNSGESSGVNSDENSVENTPQNSGRSAQNSSGANAD